MNDDRNERNDISEELNSRLNEIEAKDTSTSEENVSRRNTEEEATERTEQNIDNSGADNANTQNISADNANTQNINAEDSNTHNIGDQNTNKESTNSESIRTVIQNDYNQDRITETQKVWQMHNFNANPNVNNQGQIYNNPNNYYKESYKKTYRKSDTWKYVLVSLVSSILGGAILTGMLLGVAPIVQPSLKNFLGIESNGSLQSNQAPVGELKRVEIVQTAESAVTSVAEKVGPSVVGIRISYQNINDLFGVQSDGGEGSGIIISTDGYILTNHHVIERAIDDRTRKVQAGAKIQVYLPNKIDKPYDAEIKGYDSKTDLAVIKINENNLNAIEFGDSSNLKIGEPAIAIGNPGGLEYMGSVTQGVISGLNRTVQLENGKKIRLIQTDAAINPGNSGGALVNIKGELIGVNTVKMVATGFEGLGFAIPVDDAKSIAEELIKNTYISKPYLGISVDQRYTEDIAKENNMPMGVYVAQVELLGAADKGGIKAGDVITKFENKAIKSFSELEEEKNKHKPGDTVTMELYRDGKTISVKVKLGETK